MKISLTGIVLGVSCCGFAKSPPFPLGLSLFLLRNANSWPASCALVRQRTTTHTSEGEENEVDKITVCRRLRDGNRCRRLCPKRAIDEAGIWLYGPEDGNVSQSQSSAAGCGSPGNYTDHWEVCVQCHDHGVVGSSGERGDHLCCIWRSG